MSYKLNEPHKKANVKKIKPKMISYEIIWAVERKAPKKAYFELLAHPPTITPYTPNEESANKNNNVV
jgi:hypothetical protein